MRYVKSVWAWEWWYFHIVWQFMKYGALSQPSPLQWRCAADGQYRWPKGKRRRRRQRRKRPLLGLPHRTYYITEEWPTFKLIMYIVGTSYPTHVLLRQAAKATWLDVRQQNMKWYSHNKHNLTSTFIVDVLYWSPWEKEEKGENSAGKWQRGRKAEQKMKMFFRLLCPAGLKLSMET